MVDRQLAPYPPIASKPALSPQQLRVSNKSVGYTQLLAPKKQIAQDTPAGAALRNRATEMGQVVTELGIFKDGLAGTNVQARF